MAYEVLQRALIPRTINNRPQRQGLVFDGSVGASYDAAISILGTKDFTYSAIINSSSISGSVYTWIFGGNTGCLGIAITLGAIRLTKVNVAEVSSISYNTFAPSKSYHIVVVRSNGVRSTYVNNTLIDSSADTNDYTGANTCINGYNAYNSLSTACTIYSPLIYNRALSASEVEYLYETGSPLARDYNKASNTALSCTTFLMDFSGAGTISSASATGFTLAFSGGNTPYVYSNATLLGGTGKKFRVTFTLTRNSGTTVDVVIAEASTAANLEIKVAALAPSYSTATTYTYEFTTNYSYTTPRIYFSPTSGGNANFTISNYYAYPLGLLTAPEATQIGGGVKWYDTSGNGTTLSFPSTGVSWNIPFAGTIRSNSNLSLLTSATDSIISLLPGSTGDVEIFQPSLVATTEYRGLVIRNTSGTRTLGLGLSTNYNWIQSFNSKPLVINELGNNVLIGGTTDNGYKLEVSGTTKFGGNSYITGNVGIGTASPSSMLNISDTNYVAYAGPTFRMSNAHLSDAVLIDAYPNCTPGTYAGVSLGGSVRVLIRPVTAYYGIIGTDTNSHLAFITNSIIRAMISDGGNFLIGSTVDGGQKLQVTGNSIFTGKINTAASTTTSAGIILPHGSAPTSPVNGDMWTTTAGLYIQINGSTVGPLGTGGGAVSSVSGTTNQVTVSPTTGSVVVSLPTSIINVNSLTAQSATNFTINGGSTGATIVAGQGTNGSITLTPKGTGVITAAGSINVSGNSTINSTGAKTIAETPLTIGTSTGGANDFQLIFYRTAAGSGTSYYSIESVEQGISYRNLVLQPNGGNVGIGTTSPSFKLDNYNSTFRSLSVAAEKLVSVTFANGVADQKVDIIFDITPGGTVFWGNLEVEITSGYDNQNSVGKLIKVFSVGLNPAGGSGPYNSAIYDNTSYYSAAYGVVADNWAIDGMFFNTTTGKYYFTVIHRVSTGNSIQIKVKGFSQGVSHSTSISTLTAGSVYTTNTTVYYKPVIESVAQRIGYNGNINQTADLIVQGIVGLGISSPAAPLHVRGQNGGGDITLKLQEYNGETWTFHSGGRFSIDNNGGTSMFSIGGTTAPNGYLNISSAGNIGIGTTSPVQKVHINGTVGNTATTGTTQNGILRFSNTTDNAVFDIGIRGGGLGAWLQSTDKTDLSVNYPLLLNPNGGNVGIGTTSPSTKLHINGGMAFGYGSDAVFYTGTEFDSSKYLILQNNTDSYGRVGLAINAKTFSAAGTPSTNDGWGLSSPRSGIRFNAYLSGDTDYTTKFNIQHLLANAQSSYGDLGILAAGYSTSSPAFVVTGIGRVGINKYNPATVLDVSGNASVSGNFSVGTTSANSKLSIHGSPTSDNSFTYLVNILNTDTTITAGMGAGISFGSNVNTGGGNNIVHLSGIIGIKENATSTNYAGALTFWTRANGAASTEKLRIDSVGNVGIGTTAPSVGFEYQSNTPTNTADKMILQGGYPSGGGGQDYGFYQAYTLKHSSNLNVWTAARIKAVESPGYGGQLIFETNPAPGTPGTATTAAMRIAANGNISVYSTTASSSTSTGALIVSGGVGIAGAIYAGGILSVAGTGVSQIQGTLLVGNQGAIGASLDVQTASGTASTFRLYQNGVSNWVWSVPASTDALVLSQYGSTEAMRFDSSRNATFTAGVTVNGVLTANTSLESLRANRNISGGGIITVDASYNVIWSTRFIVISNGRGSNFSTTGYFDITCPTSGTITGVGGASSVTATSNGIPLSPWVALYYILPIGSGNSSLAANFRVVSYTSDINIPAEWVLICIRNGDTDYTYFANGIVLSANQSSVGGLQTSANTANSVVKRDGSGNFSANAATFASTVTATQFIATAGSSTAGSVWAATTAGLIIQAKTGSIQDFVITNPGATANIIEVATGTINAKFAGITSITNTTASSSTTTGALIVSGGVGIAGATFIGGNLTVSGALTVQDGTESTGVFGLKSFTKSLQIGTTWLDTGISGTDLTTGSYLVQVFVNNYTVSGGQYSETYTGVMSWFDSGTNSTDYDEIVLHKAGHAPNGNWINLRTLRQVSSQSLKLQIIASGNTTGAVNYVFKFRRLV